MKKGFTLLLSLFFVSILSFGQIPVQKNLYHAFVRSDIRLWQNAVESNEKNLNLSNSNEKLQLVHSYYGYASTLIGKHDHTTAKQIIEKAYKLIDELLEANPKNAVALNYKGVFGGYEAAINKLKAATVGQQGIKHINNALKLAPNNPQILFDKGNTLYYTPKMFGGDKKEALKYYQKAIKILEEQGKTKQNWIYLQLLFSEAHCLELTGQLETAKNKYEQILKLEPNYKLVKEKYLPNLLKKLK